jgi:DNA helicase II / ATP-dependent DNA helicase PcrA
MLEPVSTANRLLEGLNPTQSEAVFWGRGPLLVLAGPGTGKTKVLTNRIARLLEESAGKKFRILGLTFTNKAADEMRARVETLVPRLSSRLFLGTFHSFCADVLRQHGVHLGISSDYTIYASKADREAILRDALEIVRDNGGEVNAADAKLLPVITRLRAELIDPEDAPSSIASTALKARIKPIYEAYDHALRRSNALDFESIIFYAVKLFRRFPVLAKRYREVYSYWCVDEFQDTNTSQYALLRAMAGDEFNDLLVVADDDQIIFGWNGASHRRIDELIRDFSPTVLQLPTNYRSPPSVVKLANSLIVHNVSRVQGKLPIEAGKIPDMSAKGNVVRLGRRSSDREEAKAVAANIKTLHASELGRVAVLARGNRLLTMAQEELRQAGLDAVLAQRRDDFASAPFVWLQACLELSNQRRNRKTLEILCATFRELTGVDVALGDVIAAADATHEDYLRQWAEMVNDVASPDAQDSAKHVMVDLVRATDHARFSEYALQWFSKWEVPGEDERFVGYGEDRAAWLALYRDITTTLSKNAPLDAFLHELQLRSKAPPPPPNAVTLTTIHAAKGKEFDHVYVMGLVEDELPSYHAIQRGDRSLEMEEERRNCFVAITRARETLTLTYADTCRGYSKKPSRFLYEMGLLQHEGQEAPARERQA